MVDTDDTRRTTQRVWHKLSTGELKTLSKLDLDPRCQGHGRNQNLGNKKHATQKKICGSLSNWFYNRLRHESRDWRIFDGSANKIGNMGDII